MQDATIDLTSQLATYRGKLTKLAKHLSGLDDATRDKFRYKGVRIQIGPAERPLLAMAEEAASADSLGGWQGPCLDTIAISVLWADLLDAKKKKEAEGKGTAVRAAVAGFLKLAQGLGEELEEHREDGTLAKQRAVESAYSRVASLIDDASVSLALEGAPAASDSGAARVHPSEASAERPDLEAYLAASATELNRLAGLPGLSIARFGIDVEGTEWFLTLPEGNALAGSAAPGQPRSGAITRLLSFTAAATFQVARSYGWLLTPAHLEVPTGRAPTDRERALDRAMIRQLADLSDDVASRAKTTADRDLYQLVTPIATRLAALRHSVGSVAGSLGQTATTGPLACTLTLDELAPPPPEPCEVTPSIEAPPTLVIDQIDLEGPGYAQELIEQAFRTESLGVAPAPLGTRARKGKRSKGDREHFPSARSKPDRSVQTGRLLAAGLLCFTSLVFLGHSATQAMAMTSLPPVSPLSTLTPDVPSIRMAIGDDGREALVMVDEQDWRVFSPTEQYRRFHAACELLASSGYSSAVFRDRRDRELATWRAGAIRLTATQEEAESPT